MTSAATFRRYDARGLVVEEISPNGERTGFAYDAHGNCAEVTLAGGATWRFRYDRLGRCAAEIDPFGAETRYRWSARGDLLAVIDPTGTETRYAYDGVVRERQIVDGVEHRVESAYDREGERVLRKTSLGHTEGVERGLFGARRRTVLDGRVVVEHASDALGREVARALPGGGRIESAVDRMGRVERRRALGLPREARVGPGEPAWVGPRPESVTVDMAYRYDPVGELSASWDQRRGWTSYRYDPVGQLLARAPEQARAEVFRVDPAGNTYEAGPDAAPREYGRGNQLVRKGNTRYRWDTEGRLAEKSVEDPATGARRAWSYTWNLAGLLESVTTPEGERIEFRYDPFGRRVEKCVGKAPASSLQAFRPRSMTRFVWDGDVLVHEISRRAQAEGEPAVEVKTYCFEDDGFAPAAHCDAGAWFHYVNDPIGTPERLVDERGEVACELRREEWGRTEAAPGARTSTAIRFQGQYEDPETGLCYNRFRYYDPDAGRFVSGDPIGVIGGLNGWAYTLNPLGWIDAFGLISANHDRIAHGGYYTRKAQRRAAYTGTSADYVKHKRARSCADAATMSANNGNAQYDPSVNPDALEREALRKGTVTRGNPIAAQSFHTLHRFESPVGYANGEPTRWLRVEYSSGAIHGHPRALSDVRKSIPGTKP